MNPSDIPPDLRFYGPDAVLLILAVVVLIRYGCWGHDPAADWRALKAFILRRKSDGECGTDRAGK
jgi:hypothetical protein